MQYFFTVGEIEESASVLLLRKLLRTCTVYRKYDQIQGTWNALCCPWWGGAPRLGRYFKNIALLQLLAFYSSRVQYSTTIILVERQVIGEIFQNLNFFL